MLGKWTNSGNRAGLVWDYRDPKNYSAVLLSVPGADRPGTVEVIEVVAGTTHVLASTERQMSEFFNNSVSVSRIDGVLHISAPGLAEPNLSVVQQARGGDVGLIASWNLVRFDSVVFSAQNGPN